MTNEEIQTITALLTKRYGEDLAQDVLVRLLEREESGKTTPDENLIGLALKIGHDMAIMKKRHDDLGLEMLTADGLLFDVEGSIDPERIVAARELLAQCDPEVVDAFSGEGPVPTDGWFYAKRRKFAKAANDYEAKREAL